MQCQPSVAPTPQLAPSRLTPPVVADAPTDGPETNGPTNNTTTDTGETYRLDLRNGVLR